MNYTRIIYNFYVFYLTIDVNVKLTKIAICDMQRVFFPRVFVSRAYGALKRPRTIRNRSAVTRTSGDVDAVKSALISGEV